MIDRAAAQSSQARVRAAGARLPLRKNGVAAGDGVLVFTRASGARETPDSSDAALAAAVARALAWDLWIPEQRLHVTVGSGRVTLEGELDSSTQLKAAISDVLSVDGVHEVWSRLTVRPTPPQPEVEASVIRALGASSLPPGMRVETFPGAVLLRGCIGTRAQRTAAHRAAGAVRGVREVFDYLQVHPEPRHPEPPDRPACQQDTGGRVNFFPLNDP